MTGDRRGTWALHVTKNWRLTSRVDRTALEIIDLDFEDDHQVSTMIDQGLRLRSPAHPGGFLRTEVIEGRGLSVTEAAEALGVTRPALSALLNAKTALSSEMALRFEKAFGLSLETLMRMQNSYDIALVRKREGDIDVQPYAPREKPAREASLS